jgi:hypothetical protein
MKIQLSGGMAPCPLLLSDVSEGLAASIFRDYAVPAE